MSRSDQDIIDRVRSAAEELTGHPATRIAPTNDLAPRRRLVVMTLSAASVIALIGGLGLLAARTALDDGHSLDSTDTAGAVVVDRDAGSWWDLAAAPAGTRRTLDADLAGTSVCTDWVEDAQAVRCTRLEGAVGAAYYPADAVENPDETEQLWRVRTVFGVDADTFAAARSGKEVAVRPTVVRAAPGWVIEPKGPNTGDLSTAVVWSPQPDRFVEVASLTLDVAALIDLADQLVGQTWPSEVTPPLGVISLGPPWSSGGNSHSYVMAFSGNASGDCVSVSFVPRPPDVNEALRACARRGAPSWLIGSIDQPDETLTGDGAFDVIAGLAPPDVDEIRLESTTGATWSSTPVLVPGFDQRAWSIVVDGQRQGTPLAATLTTLRNNEPLFTSDFVAVASKIYVDEVCGQGDGIVPDLVGLTLFEATTRLHEHGLIPADSTIASPQAVVSGQQPTGGTTVGCGDVLLTIFEPESDPASAWTLPSGGVIDHNGYVIDGPVVATPPCDRSERPECVTDDGLVTGALVVDRGCLFMDASETELRLATLWPPGTSWDATGSAVVGAHGDLTPVGTRVELGGGEQNNANLEFMYPNFAVPTQLDDCANRPGVSGLWLIG